MSRAPDRCRRQPLCERKLQQVEPACEAGSRALGISKLDIPGGIMTRSTVFKSNRSQAVRLPKAVAFPEGVHQVEIIKAGDSRVITPVGRRWDDFFLNGPRVSDDFMTERDDPPPEE